MKSRIVNNILEYGYNAAFAIWFENAVLGELERFTYTEIIMQWYKARRVLREYREDWPLPSIKLVELWSKRHYTGGIIIL